MQSPVTRALVAFFLLCSSSRAHDVEADAWTHGSVWSFDPWIIGCLCIAAALYALGVKRAWRHAGFGRGVRLSQVAAFVGGWAALFVALVSPLDALGAALFSAHMIQHEMLMIVAAPLFVLSRPLGAWTWAFPLAARRALGRATRQHAFAVCWRSLTAPLVAWTVHALVLWAWHAPPLFSAALRDNGIHTLQHFSFLAAALLFWWTVLGRDARRTDGAALCSLLTTMIHSGALGALLTLSPNVWYVGYIEPARALDLDPLIDQQLGGLLMWVPAGVAYLFAGLFLVARWLRAPGDRQGEKIAIAEVGTDP